MLSLWRHRHTDFGPDFAVDLNDDFKLVPSQCRFIDRRPGPLQHVTTVHLPPQVFRYVGHNWG